MGEVLKENGFNTSWFGKMHNVPDWMSSQAGPFDLWPSGSTATVTPSAGRARRSRNLGHLSRQHHRQLTPCRQLLREMELAAVGSAQMVVGCKELTRVELRP
jgi:arylsulfatase A-like enzyme